MPFTNSPRFRLFFSRDPAIDRTPVVEWASWWDQTLTRWRGEGLPAADDWGDDVNDYWGQDLLHQFWCPTRGAGLPTPAAHGAPLMLDERDYERIRPALFTDELLEGLDRCIREYLEHSAGRDPVFWFTLDGFFWFPRVLFGIENHLYAFYDYPELMHRVNRDLCDFHKRTLEVIYSLITPQFMTLAEDMSYNLGPMCSREQYDEFLLPYYKELVPLIQARGTKVLIDTDGNVEPLIPWFLDGGIEGILPLERMAGVDVNRIREQYPSLLMIGGFDKTVMHRGEEAMRAEFERILPAIRSGGYIPSVDHQTPPDVSMDNYRIYMRLLREYSEKIGR